MQREHHFDRYCMYHALRDVISELFGEKVLWPTMQAHQIIFEVGHKMDFV